MFHTRALIGLDAGDHLVRIVSGKTRAARRARARRSAVHVHFHPDGHGQRIRIASRRGRQLPHFLSPGAELVGRHAGGVPPVTHRGGAAQCARARAPHPQRDRGLLHGLGRELEAGQVPARALIVGIGAGPQLLHDRHALVREGAALPEGDAQGLELLRHRAGAHAQDHPPARHLIEARGVLRELHGIVVGQDQHGGAQRDALRGRRQVRQRGEGMIVRPVVEALPDIAAVQQMVHDPDGVVAERLGERPHGEDLARIRDAPVVRDGHAEPHD